MRLAEFRSLQPQPLPASHFYLDGSDCVDGKRFK